MKITQEQYWQLVGSAVTGLLSTHISAEDIEVHVCKSLEYASLGIDEYLVNNKIEIETDEIEANEN